MLRPAGAYSVSASAENMGLTGGFSLCRYPQGRRQAQNAGRNSRNRHSLFHQSEARRGDAPMQQGYRRCRRKQRAVHGLGSFQVRYSWGARSKTAAGLQRVRSN